MRIGILVTARMGSTRLRDKHLRLIDGRPALSYLLHRISLEFAEEVANGEACAIIATGHPDRNAPLAQLADGKTLEIFYGDDDNVPLRHLVAARTLGLDGIVSVDGDDLLCAPEAMRAVWQKLIEGASLARTTGLPLGMNSWGYSTLALAQALDGASQSLLETGWGRIFSDMPSTEIRLTCADADKVRATLDYEDDLTFFSRCICSVENWSNLPVADFVHTIVANGFDKINAHLNEEYWANFSSGIALESQLGTQEKS